MAKKNNNNRNNNVTPVVATEALNNAELNAPVVPKNNAPKNAKNNSKKDPNKKPNIFVRIGRSFKEMFSEMKKVTWADGKTVVASTCVVLGVVAIFFLGLLAIDSGLAALLKLLLPKT